jgi:hypothetical protein
MSGHLGQRFQQPAPCEPPIALDGFYGDVEHLGRLFDGQPGEEPEFNNASFAGIEGRKSIKRLVKRGESTERGSVANAASGSSGTCSARPPRL